MTSSPSPQSVHIGQVQIGAGCELALIAGPCVIESREHTLRLAETLHTIACEMGVQLIFKASFDKANRSSINSYRGPGLEAGLAILSEVHMSFDVPVTSDVHQADQAQPAAQVLDLLQIPAFLCRQTDLVQAAGATGRPVNLKKGQFMSPEEMKLAVEKVREVGNEQVLLTERGTFFGYGRLVNDMTSLARMGVLGPVVFDATHSCQRPGGDGHQSGGDRHMVPVLARAAVAAGAHALFLEVHDDPAQARSDAATVWPLDQLSGLLADCKRVFDTLHS
jgi:2-dehydro-3-deoxyphosphooctonate aldolase (KDO 8-P synthase)